MDTAYAWLDANGKRTFAEALRRRRCLVPATAFYEWVEASRQPHAFALTTKVLFGIAGLWETIEKDGERRGAFLLLTVVANPVVAPVHHRMAMILSPADEDRWLDPSTPPEEIQRLITPLDPEAMISWTVSKAVNSVRNNGPEIISSD